MAESSESKIHNTTNAKSEINCCNSSLNSGSTHSSQATTSSSGFSNNLIPQHTVTSVRNLTKEETEKLEKDTNLGNVLSLLLVSVIVKN